MTMVQFDRQMILSNFSSCCVNFAFSFGKVTLLTKNTTTLTQTVNHTLWVKLQTENTPLPQILS